MNNELMQLPQEVAQIAKGVTAEKQNEVQQVLNHVFNGVEKMRQQLDVVDVKDHTDTTNMKLARTIRLGVREVRLDAEKTLDAKRSEVQAKMLAYKTEDALWLKAKQTMQILTKEIEAQAKWKEETQKRYEQEQAELKLQQRLAKVQALRPDIQREEIENMSENMFEVFYQGLQKAEQERIEAEKKAEQERIERQRIQQLHEERKELLIPYWNFVPEAFKALNMGMATDMEFKSVLEQSKKAFEEDEAEREKQRKEAERLKAEAEAREKKFAEERAKQDSILKAEREAKAKAEAELKAKQEAEAKAKAESEAKAKAESEAKKEAERKALAAPDKEKLLYLSEQFKAVPLPYLKTKEAIEILSNIETLVAKLTNYINEKANQL